MKRFTNLTDCLFFTLVFFLINRLWFSYSMPNKAAALTLSILDSMLFFLFMISLRRKLNAKHAEQEQEQCLKQTISNNLLIMSKDYYIKTMDGIVRVLYPNVRRISRYLYYADKKIISIARQSIPSMSNDDCVLLYKIAIKTNCHSCEVVDPFTNELTYEGQPFEKHIRVVHMDKIIKAARENDLTLPEEGKREIHTAEKQTLLNTFANSLRTTPPMRYIRFAIFWVLAALISGQNIYYFCIAILFAFMAVGSFRLQAQARKIF